MCAIVVEKSSHCKLHLIYLGDDEEGTIVVRSRSHARFVINDDLNIPIINVHAGEEAFVCNSREKSSHCKLHLIYLRDDEEGTKGVRSRSNARFVINYDLTISIINLITPLISLALVHTRLELTIKTQILMLCKVFFYFIN